MRCCNFSVKPAVPTAVKALTVLKITITIILKRLICELRDQLGKSFSDPFSPQQVTVF